jgi:hypothetical protein
MSLTEAVKRHLAALSGAVEAVEARIAKAHILS